MYNYRNFGKQKKAMENFGKLSKKITTLINIQKWTKSLTPTCVKPMLGDSFYYEI